MNLIFEQNRLLKEEWHHSLPSKSPRSLFSAAQMPAGHGLKAEEVGPGLDEAPCASPSPGLVHAQPIPYAHPYPIRLPT